MKKTLKLIYFLFIIFCLLFTAGIVRSYGWPVISTLDIENEKIKEDRTFCVIGDLHSKNFSTLVNQIEEQKPDFIIMAGDIFDADIPNLERTIKTVEDLVKVCDVYFAMGNHELSLIDQSDNFLNKLQSTGVKIIDHNYFDINEDLRIGGLYDYPFGWDKFGNNTVDSAPEDVQVFLMDFIDTDRFTLFAAHRPDSFYYSDASVVYPIDLVISSHIHGGQVVVPFKGGLYGGEQGWWPKYVHGYYQKNNINWLITSGLSTSKKKFPRFNNPPEIYVVHLKHK